MYRLPSAVTTRAATPGGLPWGCGRRAAHYRARLPLGPGWVGGLGLGLGLALGVKLAGGLRGAAPAPSPTVPDPEVSPQVETPPLSPPKDQPLAPWSPQTPTPPTSRLYARAIDSSRDLLHRIKVRRRGSKAVGNPAPQPGNGTARSTPQAELTPIRAMGCPRSASEKDFPFSDRPATVTRSWGVAQIGVEVTARLGDRPFPLRVPTGHTPRPLAPGRAAAGVGGARIGGVSGAWPGARSGCRSWWMCELSFPFPFALRMRWARPA